MRHGIHHQAKRCEPRYFDIAAAEKGYAEIEDNEETDALLAAAGLTEKQKRVYRLYYGEGNTTYEIAAILGINQSNAHRQLETINKALKKYFENLL